MLAEIGQPETTRSSQIDDNPEQETQDDESRDLMCSVLIFHSRVNHCWSAVDHGR